MSQREFFSYRFAVPGYIFILFLLAINYVPLLTILKETGLDSAFGAFLAFLSLFTGSALGFMIAQFWWWWFNHKGRTFGLKKLEGAEKALINKYKPEIENAAETERKKWHILIFDYIILNGDKQGDKLWKYAERRWDIYHVLSSTCLALIISYIIGVFVRIYFEIFIFQSSVLTLINAFSWDFLSGSYGAEFFAQIFFLICMIISLAFVQKGRENIIEEYSRIVEAVVHHSHIERERLRAIFPSCFKPLPSDKASAGSLS
jgi:hypothetical protein